MGAGTLLADARPDDLPVTDETGKKWAPIVAAVVSLTALGWLLLPFEGGGQVRCRAGLGREAKPTRSLEIGPITFAEAESCRDGGRSRGVTAGFIALLAVVTATATVALPAEDERDWPASWFR